MRKRTACLIALNLIVAIMLTVSLPSGLSAQVDLMYTSGFEGPGRIEFITDQSALFTGPGQTMDFEVRVFDYNDVEIPNATVQWYPEDDTLFTLEPLGSRMARVTATGFALGNVGIRVASPQAGAHAMAQVIFADLQANVFSFSSDQVVSVDRITAPDGPYTVVLPRNATTETIDIGDLVISGDRAGLLDRVLSVNLTASEVELTTELASLTDAFENLSYSASTLAIYGSSEDPDALPLGREIQGSIDSAQCKTQNNTAAPLTTTGASVSFSYSILVDIDITIGGGTLQGFELGPSATATVAGQSGSLEWSSMVAGEIKCALTLITFKTPALPLHMFSFQLGMTPEIGIKAEASFTGPSFTVTGPKGNVTGLAEGGIRWAPGGWSTYGTASWNGSFDPFEAMFDTNIEFGLKAKPYGMLGFSAIANLGRPPLGVSLAELSFAEVEGGLPGELNFGSPFDITDPGYEGPSWKITANLDGKLKAELSGGALQKLLNTLGVPTSIDLGDANLWDPIEIELAASPTATLSADCQPSCILSYSLFDSAVLTLDITNNSTANGQASFLTSKNGATPMVEVANDSVSGGSGSATWQPVAADLGNHNIYGRYSIDLLSQAFPYAVTDPLPMAVAMGCAVPVTCPDATVINENDGDMEKIALAYDGGTSCTVAAGNPNLGDNDDFMIRLDSDPQDGPTWDDAGTSDNWSRSPGDFGENRPAGSYLATMTRAGSGDQFELKFTVNLVSQSPTIVEMTVSNASICPISAP